MTHSWGPVNVRRLHLGPITAFYGVACLLSAGYVASLLIRRSGQTWPLLDDWIVDGFEVLLAIACLARAVLRSSGRSVALVLGLGLAAWAAGDIAWTVESLGGATPPTPSVADGLYLAFYPLAYLAVMLLIRSEVKALQMSVWLDGLVAGLGAAAICAAFGIDTIIGSVSGSSLAISINLAYPIGDLILLGLAVGALVIVPGWPVRLLMIGIGCGILAIGDTVYLVQSAAGSYVSGTALDATWPVAFLFLSMAAWQRVGSPSADGRRTPSFVLPGLASASAVIILAVGTWHRVSGIAVGLAVATLLITGTRRLLSLREIHALAVVSHQQSVTDDLTGLNNRRQLMNVLASHFSSATSSPKPDRPLALLMIDLNGFKEINDSFGHPTGDDLLTQIGPRLAASTRSSDFVARLGGDEFAVLLTGADVAYATSIAERITKELERPFLVDGVTLHVGASIGVGIAPQHATSSAELMRCADVAMYRAKAANCDYEIYESALDDSADRLQLMEALRAALDAESLILYYQPQIDLRTGAISSLEALLRWQHPEFGNVPPSKFIPLAEESGLMGILTSFVLERAIAQCAAWRKQGHDVTVAVNLSTTNLLDIGLPDQIEGLLDNYGLPPEGLVMADLTRSKQVIRQLSDFGIIVSIDDFGSGFSSLAYLSNLAVGELKIDRVFTARLSLEGNDGRDEAIVRSSIDLGHSLGMRVVAEGVERADHFGFLVTAGCDVAQGFVIGFPLPPERIDFKAIDERSAPLMPKTSTGA
jgi:diguanylate cyclase (GGDEF)-like protein